MPKHTGRPSMAAKDRRETLAKTLVTTQECEELQHAAERDGLSLSAWLRVIALRAARQKHD